MPSNGPINKTVAAIKAAHAKRKKVAVFASRSTDGPWFPHADYVVIGARLAKSRDGLSLDEVRDGIEAKTIIKVVV